MFGKIFFKVIKKLEKKNASGKQMFEMKKKKKNLHIQLPKFLDNCFLKPLQHIPIFTYILQSK